MRHGCKPAGAAWKMPPSTNINSSRISPIPMPSPGKPSPSPPTAPSASTSPASPSVTSSASTSAPSGRKGPAPGPKPPPSASTNPGQKPELQTPNNIPRRPPRRTAGFCIQECKTLVYRLQSIKSIRGAAATSSLGVPLRGIVLDRLKPIPQPGLRRPHISIIEKNNPVGSQKNVRM